MPIYRPCWLHHGFMLSQGIGRPWRIRTADQRINSWRPLTQVFDFGPPSLAQGRQHAPKPYVLSTCVDKRIIYPNLPIIKLLDYAFSAYIDASRARLLTSGIDLSADATAFPQCQLALDRLPHSTHVDAPLPCVDQPRCVQVSISTTRLPPRE